GTAGGLGGGGTAGGLGGGGTAGGLGGGGTAGGLGELGTTGLGSGWSGRGSGGGSLGSKGVFLAKDWRHVGFNPVELASDDFLSTFSIDVDTGSYTQARRMIHEGTVPPPRSVRTEEFVNYLDYVYPQPDEGQPFSITLEAAPHPWIAGHQILRIGIQGDRLTRSERPSMHLTFLVDTSCSMTSDDKLPLAKAALHHLVENLRPDDTVALASYAGHTAKLLDPTPAASAPTIHRAIDGLSSGGGTAMADGMRLAYDMARAAHVDGEESRVLVLSDGDANIGQASPTQILDTLAHHAGQGITLSTVGFGAGNYRDTMMEQLADRGDGNYVYIDSQQEAERVFGEDIGATLQTIARDVKIQVQFDPDSVLAYRLLGYENREIADADFRNDEVDAGEVGAGHSVTALYDVVLRDDPPGDIATVRIRYRPPGADRAAQEIAVRLPTAALHPSIEDASRDLRLALGCASFAEKLRGAREVEEISYAQIAGLVRQGLRSDTERDDELLELIQRIDAITSGDPLAHR
ncbi:MAG TPA: DUF3520 domain-containing protein, partial [Deltaproteobacteria bacterium]|nr:DUF3520 domain-containing protein [Deltaproteobacteria bacterium]